MFAWYPRNVKFCWAPFFFFLFFHLPLRAHYNFSPTQSVLSFTFFFLPSLGNVRRLEGGKNGKKKECGMAWYGVALACFRLPW
jgi:hypothetical protein